LYAALRRGDLDITALRGVLLRHPLEGGQPVYAVDVSVWPRCDAATSPERGFYYHPSRHLDGTPVVKGWAYQWIAQLGFARESWTAPVDVQRVPLEQTPTVAAIAQVTALLDQLPPSAAMPLFVFDAGYDLGRVGTSTGRRVGRTPHPPVQQSLLLRRAASRNGHARGAATARRRQVRLR